MKHLIEFNGKDYEVQEPTLNGWAQLNLLKDIEEDDDFSLSLLSISTGISEDDLLKANFVQVKEAAEYLSNYFITLGEQFYPDFVYKGVKYKFFDMGNMSFGEYVDIDNFLQKDKSYTKSNMRELMAILYRPVMDDGTIEGYNITNTKRRAELFRDLPVKYLQGSMRFFFHLEKVLKETTPFYLRTYQSLRRKLKRHLKPLGKIGDGMGLLYSWLKRTLKKSPK
tara:strand:+ start:2385 stop:3056 length:672 start_codon:yes stop_codon:yes gene_type:complete